MSVTFEEIVRAWTLHYDKRLPSNQRGRREAFIILLGNLADHGFTKDELTGSRKQKIILCCVNPNHSNKSKLRKWCSMLGNDLEDAVTIYYPNVKIRDDIVTAEMTAKLESIERKEEESKALRTEDTDEADDGTFDPFSPEPASEKPSNKEKSSEKVIETTDEMLEKMSGPTGLWDEDLIKELGIKIYE